MKISLHVYIESRVSNSAFIQLLEVDRNIDASEICEVIRAKALTVWDEGCKGPQIKSGKLEGGTTYHVITQNWERTRKIIKTLSKISKL